MTESPTTSTLLQAIRAALDLTQAELAERLGVSFATVNRWEGGSSKPQRAQLAKINTLAEEAGVDASDVPLAGGAVVTRRRGRQARPATPTTKPMEQMLWDAACSIRGEKDAPKFKDYLLPLLFLKRLSDVFDDEIDRLAEEYGDRDAALEIAEDDHELLRFYLPPEARWAVISGREQYEWPDDERGRRRSPKDIGEHLTKAVRAVVRHNPTLSGVIDVVDFAAERNGERDINPAKLRGVVETFSDPRYRLGLADVQPDFLGRAYEYLLRKFAEGSGQSAGEFFTPTEVGFLMAHIMRPKPGRELPRLRLRLGGPAGEAAARRARTRSDQQGAAQALRPGAPGRELRRRADERDHPRHGRRASRGDTMINPKFRTPTAIARPFDIVVANPMWNQPFDAGMFRQRPVRPLPQARRRHHRQGRLGVASAHAVACLNDHGRAAVVLDTGAVTRGSGSKNEDKERNIRKWFVDRDLIDGVILLPDNLFYNTTAAGVIVVLNKRKPAARKDKIVAAQRQQAVQKGKPKNYIPDDGHLPTSRGSSSGEPVDGEVAVIDLTQIAEADYNLSPSRWVRQAEASEHVAIPRLLAQLDALAVEDAAVTAQLQRLVRPLAEVGVER